MILVSKKNIYVTFGKKVELDHVYSQDTLEIT